MGQIDLPGLDASDVVGRFRLNGYKRSYLLGVMFDLHANRLQRSAGEQGRAGPPFGVPPDRRVRLALPDG